MRVRISLHNVWTKIFLLSAFLNAVLKAHPESDITAFRILLPFYFIIFFANRKSSLREFLLLTAVFFVFQGVSIFISDYPISFVQVVFTGHYLTMIFVFFLTVDYFKKAPHDLYRFLRLFYTLLIIALTMELVFGFQLPNTNDRGLNAWYWNQNDASLAVAGFLILALRMGDHRAIWPVHLLAILIIALNDSRAALWGVLGYTTAWYLATILRRHQWKNPLNRLLISLISITTISALLMSFSDKVFEAVNQLISGIMILFGSGGDNFVTSIGVRSYAALYGIEDFLNSYGFGTGAGNSITMLAINDYLETSLVRSIHNMPLQMLLELGLPLLMLLIFGLKKHSPLNIFDFIGLIITYSFISLTQSGGFLVNYFPLVCFYFCLLMPREGIERSRESRRLPRPTHRQVTG